MKARSPPVVATLFLIALLLVPWGVAEAAGSPTDSDPVRWDKVDDGLRARLEGLDPDERVDVLLRLSSQAALEEVAFQRAEVLRRLHEAAASQDRLRPRVEAAGFTVERGFWIANYLLVTGPAGRVGELTRPSAVARVLPNFEVFLVDGESTRDPEPAAALTWGLERVGADRVWSSIGTRGQGARVCVSDTGVDIGHPDLDGRMVTASPGDSTYPGGWIEFDSSGNPVAGSTPHDTQGHGTHTSGTVLGGDASGVAIGMAPEAGLMHALVLPGGGGTFGQVIAGIEWCVDPTDDQGSPAGEPADVHSMSWGATGYYDEMVDPIRNSYFAGTVPVAAAGNCGEGCSGSPGNVYDALGIGASDESDAIALFSSGEVVQKADWGAPPADWPDEWTVPLLSAPGVNVYSSVPGGGYESWQGTSMATPHVAGCTALMRSANPSLSSADVRDALLATVDWFDTYAPEPPDTRYGWGRLDCIEAVELVAFDSGLTGTLHDAGGGAGVDQAWVNASAPGVQRAARSDADGGFRMSLAPGTYNVTIERWGYEAQALPDVTVAEEEWITLNRDLVPLPRGNVTGQVLHNATTTGLPGVTLSLLDVPVVLAAPTDPSGTYALEKVPEGTYAVRATSPYFRDGAATEVVVVADANVTVDFHLDPRDWVAVMGDQGSSLSTFLRDSGYYVENPEWWEVIDDPARYRTVVVNHPYGPGSTTFNDFLAATDAAGTGVIFLDTWEHTYTGGGIYYLWSYLADPASRSYGYDSTQNFLYYNVTASHPILDPHGVGDRVELENATLYHDYAWFDGYVGENGTVLAQAGSDPDGDFSPGIAVDERANNRHVLLSLHGASNYVGPSDWTEDGARIFRNAVAWAQGNGTPEVLPVDYDLRVAPEEGLWSEVFEVSVDVKNVGSADGNYTARLEVNGWTEAVQTVPLAAGASATVTFNVTRDPVGSYRVSLGPHETSFRVRPPRVTVEARDLNASAWANATILVGLGTAVLDMGRTDGDGTLTFDSPAGSHGQYWIVLRTDGIDEAASFLFTESTVETDLTVAFQPTLNDTTLLELSMDPAAPGQEGTVFLRSTDMPTAYGDDFAYRVDAVRVERRTYAAWARTTVPTPGSTWSFDTAPVVLDLNQNATFSFGGPYEALLSWSQVGTDVSVDWTVQDAYGNDVVRVAQTNVGILGVGDTLVHQPLLSFWDAQETLLRSGYVAWDRHPANVTLDLDETVAFVQLDLETGAVPVSNTFVLEADVRDGDGESLGSLGATPDAAVEVVGSVLRSGEPIPANVTVNGEAVVLEANGTFSHWVNLTAGFNNLTVTARDLAGNQETWTAVVVSKLTVLLLLDALPTVTNASALKVSGAVEVGAALTVNGQSVTADEAGRFAFTVTLVEGENDIAVVAVDVLGTRKEVVRTVTLDTVPPAIRVLAPSGPLTTRDDAITVAGETDPAATLTVNGDPVPLDDGTFTLSVPLQPGENVLELRAQDPAGNVATETLTVHRESLFAGAVPYLYLTVLATAGLATTGGLLAWQWWRRRADQATRDPDE